MAIVYQISPINSIRKTILITTHIYKDIYRLYDDIQLDEYLYLIGLLREFEQLNVTLLHIMSESDSRVHILQFTNAVRNSNSVIKGYTINNIIISQPFLSDNLIDKQEAKFISDLLIEYQDIYNQLNTVKKSVTIKDFENITNNFIQRYLNEINDIQINN